MYGAFVTKFKTTGGVARTNIPMVKDDGGEREREENLEDRRF